MSARKDGTGRTVYINGAGIAGLTLALALAKFGVTVVVMERTAKPHTQGAGLQISPNARIILDRLGLSRALDACTFQPEAIDVYPYRRGAPLASLTLGAAARERFSAPYAVAHRADLLNVLHAACRRFANIDIMFGIRALDVEIHARGVSLVVEDNRANVRTARPFALVGADGVHSQIRMQTLDGPKAKYSGYVAWRTMLPLHSMRDVLNLDRTSLLCGPGFHAVTYPIPHRDLINVALFTKETQARVENDEIVSSPKLPKLILESEHFSAILEAAVNGWAFWPLYAVKTRQWSEGPVGLIGDAAHAMLPFQAQGAAMGIEDAAVLAPLLATEPNARSAFRRFAALRQKRTRKVAGLSARNGRVFHLEWPFTIARDLVIANQSPTAHFKRLAWIYDYDAHPEIERKHKRAKPT